MPINFQIPNVDSYSDNLNHVWAVPMWGGETVRCDHFVLRRRHRELEISCICPTWQLNDLRTRIDKPRGRGSCNGSFEILSTCHRILD